VSGIFSFGVEQPMKREARKRDVSSRFMIKLTYKIAIPPGIRIPLKGKYMKGVKVL